MPRNPPPEETSYPGFFYRPREDGQNGKNGGGPPPPGTIILEETQTPRMQSAQPMAIACPFCKKQMETEVTFESGVGAWLAAGLICLAGCCCFAWIPLVSNIMKDAVHHCSECKREIGRYIRLQPNPPPRRARRSTKRRPAREQQMERDGSQKSASSWRTGSRTSQQSPREESKSGESSFFSWGDNKSSQNSKRKGSKSSDTSFFSWGDKGRSQSERRPAPQEQKRDLTDRERGEHTKKHRYSFSLW